METKKILLSAIVLMFSALTASAQVPIEEPHSFPTYIAPAYFGPYAFPVPDQLEGRICNTLKLEVSFDGVVGTVAGKDAKDYTFAPTFRIQVPLMTDRFTFSCWGEMHEWYRDTRATREIRRVDSKYSLDGHDGGNVYFSLDALLLKEGRWYPSFAGSITLLTATGDDYEKARHYDCPGYHFDGSAGKSFSLGKDRYIRASATIGFLCWQNDHGNQNDSFFWGAKVSYNSKLVTASAEYGQYKGWENCGDNPKAVKGRVELHLGRFSPFIYVQHGLHDWPFTQLRAGLAVDFDILKQ